MAVRAGKKASAETWSGNEETSITEDRKSAWGAKPGIDPQWFGRRFPDGSTEGFRDIPDGEQRLCYNETFDKINWHYLRFLVDSSRREYVELQCNERTYDLRGVQPTLAPAYPRIWSLLNLALWVEADTNRRCFLFVDSAVISTGPSPKRAPRRRVGADETDPHGGPGAVRHVLGRLRHRAVRGRMGGRSDLLHQGRRGRGHQPALGGKVQISPDGITWTDEGTTLPAVTQTGVVFARVRHFGNWLRLACRVSGRQARLRGTIYLCLKS